MKIYEINKILILERFFGLQEKKKESELDSIAVENFISLKNLELIFQTFLREREGGEIKISIAWQYCAISYNGITNRSVVLIIIGTYRRHFTKPWLARTGGSCSFAISQYQYGCYRLSGA